MICTDCGYANQAPARFCGGCGKALNMASVPAREAERRHLCVLFCDLVGSTALSQQLDPEDLRDLVQAYQSACGDVVLGHDGYVAQYLGDGIVVYFGYPRAHEDDPVRVVRCGLDMLKAVAELAKRTGRSLQVRIGIHIGRVVVGALGGSARSENLAVGDTPNIAARVQGEASPGELVVSDALWRMLGGAFATESMGTRQLKGVDQPLALFRVIATAGVDDAPDTQRTPYIGRERERARISAIWQEVQAGTPQFALLRGEPGIGKSRLIQVVQETLAGLDADVLVAKCTPFTTDTTLYPFMELVSARLGLADMPPAAQIACLARRAELLELDPAEVVPLLASALAIEVDPALWPAPDLSPVRALQRTLDLLLLAFHALAARKPVLLIVEDMHWADATSVEMMRQLLSSPLRSPLMALLTARPEFQPSWQAAGNLSHIELEALPAAESERFIRVVAHDKAIPPELLWRIRERAAGNPLFLEEVTRTVIESDALTEHEHSWALKGSLSQSVVPASMEASLMARIDRLGTARPLFQLGAVLGREFLHELLAAVAQMPEQQFRQNLNQILATGLIYSHSGSATVYTFKHALVQDVAYDSLLRSTRQRHHARIAEVLLARFSDLVRLRPEFLAHHFSGAGDHARAAARWRAAGENAAARSAVNEAVAHLRRALADLEQLPEDQARLDQELSVLTALAPVLMATHGWAAPEVGETCSRAIELARRLGAMDRLYPPLWGLWTNQFVGGRLREAMVSADEVLAMALATGVPMLEITGRHASTYTHYYRAEYERALAEAQAGLSLYDLDTELKICEIFQLSSTVNIKTGKAGALWMQGRQDEGIALMDEMLALARSLRHPPSIAAALAFCMFFSLYDRNWKRLYEFADEVCELSRAEGFAMWLANGGLHRGRARMALGQMDEGVAEVLEWGALFSQTGSGIVECSTTSMVSEAFHRAGRSDEALQVSAEGQRRAETGMVRVMLPEVFRVRGQILFELGRHDEADQACQQAVNCAQQQGAHSLSLRALTDQLGQRLTLQTDHAPVAALLRQTLGAMACSADRPDMVAATEMLARAGG